MSEEPIRTVGHYEVLEVIGRGGAAVVYLGVQRDLGRRVALKELASSQAATDANFGARFAEESRLAGSLSHPNIVTVYEYFEHDGVPYIAMEYLSQGSLRPYVHLLTLAQIAGVLEGVLAGLALGQSRSIVHRDLKPENLLVTADGRVKITDFGVARAYADAVTREVVTAVGSTIGTPAYMAPEQAAGGEVGPGTDLYSLGIVAWELLVGRVPFADTETPVAVLYRQVHEPVPPVRSVAPDVDPQIEAWLSRMLAKDPADRFPSAEAAWEKLEHVVVELLGPLWRRDARLSVIEPEAAGRPLTPAVFTHAPGAPGAPVAPGADRQGGADPTLDGPPLETDRSRRPVRRAVGIVAVLGAIAAAVAIGLSASGGGAAAGSRPPRPLTDWLVKRGDDPGYPPTGTPDVYTTPRQFVDPSLVVSSVSAKQGAAEIASFKREGYRRAVDVLLAGRTGTGLSEVIELGSPAAARGLHLTPVPAQRGLTKKQFTVPGVTSAEGTSLTYSHPTQKTAQVTFVEGSCLLMINSTAKRGDLVAGVQHAVLAVYRRTHGDCPG